MDVILVGDKKHSQTNEIIGWIKTRVILIQNIESAMSIIPITAFSKKGVCMASTTEYSQEKYDEIAKYCHNVIPNLTVKDTICKEKENRENKIRQIIINCKADIIIILGDPESINNMKSYKIAMKYCQHLSMRWLQQLITDKKKTIRRQDVNVIGQAKISSKPLQRAK